ncbi:DNA internalization-related competence protein ComEC/Rec2 [Paenibacillus doosanensis]|uniref:DNA internalization-related competence protein ComEC/Rec2 n=1 Tax=Paenibacillus doosanensis TaxID=1229154 RepID=UPI00217FFAC9|nr:DNA internalization-related competence protein ComEC/Rec2 [Paenibacillus doosanensis]MCS7458528.1 DNA internalization-related competence protein ComEC/Rec2 [Paenibacillus doosanensis]
MIRNRPVVAITLLWTFGYTIAYSLSGISWLSLYTTLIAAIAAVALWMLPIPGKTAVCGALVVVMAAGYYADYDGRNVSSLNPQAISQEAEAFTLEGVIADQVEVDGDKAAFTVQSADSRRERFAVSVKLLSRDEQAAAKTWQRADRVILQGTLQTPGEARNFDGFDYRRYLRFQHIHWQVSVKGAAQVQTASPDHWSWLQLLRWIDWFRSMLGDGMERLFPAAQSGFMKAMLIGLTNDIDPEQFQQFSQLGLTHIIAISGLHVAIFLACLLWTMRKLGFTRETYLITAMIAVPLYVAVTGAAPSIIRAGLMAVIGLYATYRQTLKDGLHTVLLVGLLMLLWEPYYLMNVSFQLSFLVTIGLIVGVPYANKLMPIRSRAWRDAFSITIVAQIVSFPVSIYYFNQFSLLSLAANFVLVPVFSMFTMPGGTIALFVSFVWMPAGKALAWIVAQVNEWLFWVVSALSRWQLFQTIWPTPGIVWIIGYYAVWSLLVYSLLLRGGNGDSGKSAAESGPMLSAKGTQAKAGRLSANLAAKAGYCRFPLAVCMVCGMLAYAYEPDRWVQEGQVHFIDVGQGDSIFIRSPRSRSVILVDGGGTVSFRKPGDEWKQRSDPYEVGRKLLVPLLKQRGIHAIDYLIVTHQDADHIGGLQAVLEQIPVKQLLFNGTIKPNPGVETLFQTALANGVTLVKVYAGDILQVDEDTRLRFMYPLPASYTDGGIRVEKEQNTESVVFLMEMQGTRWLLTGDMEKPSETKVLELIEKDRIRGETAPDKTPPLFPGTGPVDVLKVAHHGSKTSTTDAWLDAWRPQYAVISVGQYNTYGHPHPTVIARLGERGIPVLRTDADGEVQMSVKDGVIRVRTKLRSQIMKTGGNPLD